jgi:hypothetical protein
MSELEIALPVFWNTLAKQFISCRLYEQILLHGRLHAHNMLIYERIHVLLKGMCRSSKSMQRSVGNAYGMYSLSQIKNRFGDTKWANEAKQSSLGARFEAVEAKGEALPVSIKSAVDSILPDHVYSQIIDAYAAKDEFLTFRNLRDRFLGAHPDNIVEDQRVQRLVLMHQYDGGSGNLSVEQKALLSGLNREAKVHNFDVLYVHNTFCV